MTERIKDQIPRRKTDQTRDNPFISSRPKSGPVSVYDSWRTLQRTIGNQACQSLVGQWLTRDQEASLPSIEGGYPYHQIAREETNEKESLNNLLVGQINPSKFGGDIDQDTGNCSLGAKLIFLKAHGYLSRGLKLNQVLEAFYQGQNGQTRIEETIDKAQRFFVYGNLSYKRLTREERSNISKAKDLIKLKWKPVKGEEDWWAFGGLEWEPDEKDPSVRRNYRKVYRGVIIKGECIPHFDGYMVFSNEAEVEDSYTFSPLYKDKSANIDVLRGDKLDNNDLKTFMSLLKKYFPEATQISDPQSFFWTSVSNPTPGEMYIAHKPGHWLVIAAEKVTESKIFGKSFDPWNSEIVQDNWVRAEISLYKIVGN